MPVVGTLSIDGIVIGNAFTAVNDYTSYEVNKFDPIRSFTQSETVEIPTRTAEATYTKNICEVLSLRDMRDADDMKGFELIDHDATLADPWITGDDTNGFATGVRPNSDDVFGLEAIRIVSFSVTYADNGFDASAGTRRPCNCRRDDRSDHLLESQQPLVAEGCRRDGQRRGGLSLGREER